MGIKWSDPKIEKEKVKIEPEVFIKEAKEYTESGDYNMAERAYVNALSNARGASNVKEITRIVKDGLSDIYKLWIQDCISRYEYHEAEPVLQKLLKISDDKKTAKEEMIKLYDAWGLSLSIYDKNWKGALLVFIKKLKLEIELGLITTITESQICSLLFSSDNPSYRKKAAELNLGKKEVRIRMLISAILMTAVSLLAPIFAPSSIGAYIFSFVILPIRTDWEWDSYSYKKKLKKCLGLTFFSLIWFIFLAVYGSGGSWSEVDRRYKVLSVITLVFIICISFRVLLFAISQFKIYFSYQKQDIMDVIKELFPPVTVSCKSCNAKLRVSGETISAVKCPKCGNVAREAVDLKIRNKPSTSSEQSDSGEFDSQYAWGRVGFHAGRIIAREIIRNIRF